MTICTSCGRACSLEKAVVIGFGDAPEGMTDAAKFPPEDRRLICPDCSSAVLELLDRGLDPTRPNYRARHGLP